MPFEKRSKIEELILLRMYVIKSAGEPVIGIFRTFDEKAPIFTVAGGTIHDHAAPNTRAFNRANPALPNICRFIDFSRFT